MPAPLLPGDILRERYRIARLIGQGGMGCVYLAEDTRLPGRLCAVKEVRGDPTLPERTQQQAREQFYREASVLARLDHPNLPKVSDYFSEAESDYLVMDYVPGRDIKDLMDEARREGRFLPEATVLGWARQLADALDYLHRQEPPIVHRDIKPSNLKLTPSGLLKLVDFGLVKLLAPDERTVTIVQGMGSAFYTPLEQYGGDTGSTDARTDIYAFGATLYHLLTHQPPVEAKQRFLRPESLKRPRDLNPALSPHVEKAVLWAMSLHPDARPPDIATLRAALEQPDTGPLSVSARQVHAPTGEAELVVQPVIRLPHLTTQIDQGLAVAVAVLLSLAVLLTFIF